MTNALKPVLLPIPFDAAWTGGERVAQLRRYAELALQVCAERCHAPPSGWRKNADGAPQPQAGFCWSVSHKRHWAAAVIADRPVGIDVERIEARNESLWDEVAREDEWKLLGGQGWPGFFRIWTAKEAVLKANGFGLVRLDDCRIVDVFDARHLTAAFSKCPGSSVRWSVEHFTHNDHVAAVAWQHREPTQQDGGANRVDWHVVPEAKFESIPRSSESGRLSR